MVIVSFLTGLAMLAVTQATPAQHIESFEQVLQPSSGESAYAPEAPSQSPEHVQPLLSEHEELEIRTRMEEWGVDESKRDSLIEKVKAGIPLDADTGENLIRTARTIEEGHEIITSHFKDGSIQRVSLPIAEDQTNWGSVRPAQVGTNVSGCKGSRDARGNQTFTDCKARVDYFTWGFSLRVDYTYRYRQGISKITNYGDFSSYAIGGSVAMNNAWRVNQRTVRLSVTAKKYGGIGEQTEVWQIRAKGGKLALSKR